MHNCKCGFRGTRRICPCQKRGQKRSRKITKRIVSINHSNGLQIDVKPIGRRCPKINLWYFDIQFEKDTLSRTQTCCPSSCPVEESFFPSVQIHKLPFYCGKCAFNSCPGKPLQEGSTAWVLSKSLGNRSNLWRSIGASLKHMFDWIRLLDASWIRNAERIAQEFQMGICIRAFVYFLWENSFTRLKCLGNNKWKYFGIQWRNLLLHQVFQIVEIFFLNYDRKGFMLIGYEFSAEALLNNPEFVLLCSYREYSVKNLT